MEGKKSVVYTKKSLESITSPEQFSDYLKVVTPGIWMIFTAIIVLMVGIFIWSMTGELENLEGGIAVVKDGTATVTVNNSNVDINSKMQVRINNETFYISSVRKNEYGRMVAYVPVTVLDGTYDVEIITERVHPITFLFD